MLLWLSKLMWLLWLPLPHMAVVLMSTILLSGVAAVVLSPLHAAKDLSEIVKRAAFGGHWRSGVSFLRYVRLS